MNDLTLDMLPPEVLVEIFSYNSDSDKDSLSRVSKRIREISNDQLTWKKSAEKRGKTELKGDNKTFVREYLKKYNRLMCTFFPEAKITEKSVFLAKELIDLNIKDKGKNLTTRLENFLMDKEESLEKIRMVIEAGAQLTTKALNHCVISKSSLEKLHLLIKAGAPLTAAVLNTAAIHKASVEIVKTLMEAGAKPEQATKGLAESTQSTEISNMLTFKA